LASLATVIAPFEAMLAGTSAVMAGSLVSPVAPEVGVAPPPLVGGVELAQAPATIATASRSNVEPPSRWPRRRIWCFIGPPLSLMSADSMGGGGSSASPRGDQSKEARSKGPARPT